MVGRVLQGVPALALPRQGVWLHTSPAVAVVGVLRQKTERRDFHVSRIGLGIFDGLKDQVTPRLHLVVRIPEFRWTFQTCSLDCTAPHVSLALQQSRP